jgi:hypothetical protein
MAALCSAATAATDNTIRPTSNVPGANYPRSVLAQNAAPADRNAVNTVTRPGGMMADSPVKFPASGALPSIWFICLTVSAVGLLMGRR